MSEKNKIFVFGSGGHAKVVIDIIERQGRYDIAGLVDDELKSSTASVFGYEFIGGKAELLHLRATGALDTGIVAIGNNLDRWMVAVWLVENGFKQVTAIHPSAQISRGVTVGIGTVIMAGVTINSDARIGSNVIINTQASVDHDCRIDDGAHIAPGAILCGTVTVGARTFIGAGATVIENLTVGEETVVGAGATVIRNIQDRVTVVGSPARLKGQG